MPIFHPLPTRTHPRLPQAPRILSKATPPAATLKPAPDFEHWRIERVAKLLDVSKKRIYHLIRLRKLEAIRLGPRQLRIPRNSFEKYLARMRKEEEERDY